MSRKERLLSLTRYFMDAAEDFQSFPCGTHATLYYVLKPLADSFSGIGLCGYVQQALIGFRILDDRFRFAINGENQRLLGFLEAFHELSRIAPEGSHGLNVFLNVEHTHLV
jgi:hypothetical protein